MPAHLSDDDIAVYRQVANAYAGQILSGQIKVGERLPGQRDIARALNLNVTTVTRAMGVLQDMGLVESRPGRGTLVIRRQAPLANDRQGVPPAPGKDPALIDLTLNRPATPAYRDVLARLTKVLPADRRFSELQDYQPGGGPVWARQAVLDRLAPALPSGSDPQVVITHGTQHALACTLDAIARSGDTILADGLGYQGLGSLCRMRGVRVVGVDADERGIDPDHLDRLCKTHAPKAIFLVPAFHNPTTRTTDEERRRALAAVAGRHGAWIIEDAVYAPLLDTEIPAVATFAPERTIHLGGLSKCVAPGLRFGFALAPAEIAADIAAAQRTNSWSANPLSSLIATRILESDLLDDLIHAQKSELRKRHDLVRRRLTGAAVASAPTCPHAWLQIPAQWRTAAFVAALHQQGVAVLPADSFVVGDTSPPQAVRLNVAAADSFEELASALDTIVALLASGHRYLHEAI